MSIFQTIYILAISINFAIDNIGVGEFKVLFQKINLDIKTNIVPSFEELRIARQDADEYLEISLYTSLKKFQMNHLSLGGDFSKESINSVTVKLIWTEPKTIIRHFRKMESDFYALLIRWWSKFSKIYLDALRGHAKTLVKQESEDRRLFAKILQRFDTAGIVFTARSNLTDTFQEIVLNQSKAVYSFETYREDLVDLIGIDRISYRNEFDFYHGILLCFAKIAHANRQNGILPDMGKHNLKIIRLDEDKVFDTLNFFYTHLF